MWDHWSIIRWRDPYHFLWQHNCHTHACLQRSHSGCHLTSFISIYLLDVLCLNFHSHASCFISPLIFCLHIYTIACCLSTHAYPHHTTFNSFIITHYLFAFRHSLPHCPLPILASTLGCSIYHSSSSPSYIITTALIIVLQLPLTTPSSLHIQQWTHSQMVYVFFIWMWTAQSNMGQSSEQAEWWMGHR